MATYGCQILKDDGTLWLSPDFTPANLIHKGTFTASKDNVFTTSIPESKACFFFVNFSSEARIIFVHEKSGGFWRLRVLQTSDASVTVTVYAFSNMVRSTPKWGLGFYNASGEMVYNSDMLPLDAQLVTPGISMDWSQSFSYPVAVMPTFTGAVTKYVSSYYQPAYALFTGACAQKVYNGYWFSSGLSWSITRRYCPSVLVINTSKYDSFTG
ncbi:TPA: hypothetical protein J1Z86_003627 [Escherichia coli]|nr:hypothetical protein [Escherichia coli]EFI3219369.1 hypothetical protein [Escherichia coli]EFJ0448720.1 hypothetical protein [Escherichia coli]EJD5602805.1 hypothetical protein [Escherichia coli]HBA7954623.1 hypothetical protein [Escherichia coli]